MNMYPSNKNRRSFLLAETLGASVLLAGILALFALAMVQFVENNDILLARQKSILAAEAAINEIRAGHDIVSDAFSSRFGDMTFNVHREPGSGQWQGFTLVTVEVCSQPKFEKTIRVRLKGYLREDEG